MFSPSLCHPLAILIAYVAAVSVASAISTTPSLTVRTSTSNLNADGLENLKVTVTVVNTGDETLKLLNDPRGVLDSFPANSFNITGPSSSRPSFSGGWINYDTTYAARLDQPNAFTVLAPGDSINVTHDLSAAYSFSRSGAGGYSIEPSNLFTYVDADGTPKHVYATVESIAEAKLSGDLAVSKHVHGKRVKWKPRLKSKSKPKFKNCSAEQQETIIAAAKTAQKAAIDAYSSLKAIKGPAPRYTTWFGGYNDVRKEMVDAIFKGIKNTPFQKLTYDCLCHEKVRDTANAYVTPQDPKRMWICNRFWDPTVSDLHRGGLLIHQASHYTVNDGGTVDFAYGHADAHQLAKTDPLKAIHNADNYVEFVMNRLGLE